MCEDYGEAEGYKEAMAEVRPIIDALVAALEYARPRLQGNPANVALANGRLDSALALARKGG